MTQLLVAVFVASILGSAHCVGMCGPFVLLASGVAKSRRDDSVPTINPTINSHATASDPNTVKIDEARTASKCCSVLWVGSLQRMVRVSCYHAGRLTTYLLLGVAMGVIDAATDGLADYWGYANVAARVVGAVMIALGIGRLAQWLLVSKRTVHHGLWWTRWSQMVASVRKRLPMNSPYSAAYSWGLVSTWLPCGWLAIFAIAAAGAGGIPQSMALMVAFWLGTLPLLSLVALGATMLGPALHRWLQPAAAIVLIAFGIYTATSRASIALGSIHGVVMKDRSESKEHSINGGQALSVDAIKVLTSQELPCCEANSESGSEVEDLVPDGK